MLDGARDGVKSLDLRAGDLTLFLGKRSLHRVTAPEGTATRLVAGLSYSEAPGFVNTAPRASYVRSGLRSGAVRACDGGTASKCVCVRRELCARAHRIVGT